MAWSENRRRRSTLVQLGQTLSENSVLMAVHLCTTIRCDDNAAMTALGCILWEKYWPHSELHAMLRRENIVALRSCACVLKIIFENIFYIFLF